MQIIFKKNPFINFLTQKYLLNAKPKYKFARNIKPKIKISETLQLQADSKEIPMNEEHKLEDRVNLDSSEIDDEFMSKCSLNAQNLPERLLKRCQQVISKFKPSDLRKMGEDYMKIYQLLHACERPFDLTNSIPFANTEDIKKNFIQNKANLNKLIYLRNPKISQEESEFRLDEKRKEKNKKKELKKDNEEKEDIKLQSETQMNGITYTNNTALAYLIRKMPHTFGVACRIFTELRYRIPNLNPKTMLDFGAGLGMKYLIKKYKKFKYLILIK